ncbi:hypothetical protein BDM02DRAFT_3187717 [Thelephora ganbajun]|uniref:Uncharacterized protein n=1 Tax=Thelephora ganbajun TaxID=370292 RepID=A0ACB6ZEG1_THEGA|nr:hypothetical protein BDM02DRAFT_3187717 [Thelephora ganbajun]
MIFDLSREILNARLGRVPTKGRDEKSKRSRDIVSVVEAENGLPVLKKSKRLRGYSFLDNSLPCYDDVHPVPKYDSHNQPIPQNLQLKRYSSSQRYNSRQNQLVQDLSVKLIAVVLSKQCSSPSRPESRKILNEDIRVRKLRGDKYDMSYCLPKTQITPRPPR